MFIGTSSMRAGLLIQNGWNSPLDATFLREARLQARLHAAVDGGEPVVLLQALQENAGIKGASVIFELYEIGAEFAATSHERLGLSETAGLADWITNILDAAHTHLRNAIDVGRGDKNVELPALHSLFKDDDDDYGTKKPVKGEKLPSLKDIMKAHKAGISRVTKLARALHKMKNGATRIASKLGKKLKGFGVDKRKKSTRVPHVGQARKVARRTVKVAGTVNGKPATMTVKQGDGYKLGKDHVLKKPGGYTNFKVAPKDVSKL